MRIIFYDIQYWIEDNFTIISRKITVIVIKQTIEHFQQFFTAFASPYFIIEILDENVDHLPHLNSFSFPGNYRFF